MFNIGDTVTVINTKKQFKVVSCSWEPGQTKANPLPEHLAKAGLVPWPTPSYQLDNGTYYWEGELEGTNA